MKLMPVENPHENACKRWSEGLVAMTADMTLYTDGEKLVSHGVVIGRTVDGKKFVNDIEGYATKLQRARGIHVLYASKFADHYEIIPVGVAA